MTRLRPKLILYSLILTGLCLLPFALSLFRVMIQGLIYYEISALFILLIMGITLPMLSLDVRIDHFNFVLMGELISFKNQVLYFQTKGILQVVGILFSSMKFKALLTGSLILIFSVVTPFTKLFCMFYESIKGIRTRFTDFFINKASKWSMADVMVVALFLAFLGMSSVLNNLLQITHAPKNITIIPNNDPSHLEIGVIFFVLFVLLSLVTKPGAVKKGNYS